MIEPEHRTEPAVKRTSSNGVVTVAFNRPEVGNAFDDELIVQLTAILREAAAEDETRAVVLRGAGKHFSAGADLRWMQRMASASREDNLADARRLSFLLHTLATMPQVTIAVVHGAAFGGGAGLVACCDIALATPRAMFSLSEVKLGLVPAVISPYVIPAMGERQSRRYFLTAERFSADDALRFGLVHEIAGEDALEARLDEILTAIRGNGPVALREAKRLIDRVRPLLAGDELRHELAEMIADLRVSPEGREGIAAFLEKRLPKW